MSDQIELKEKELELAKAVVRFFKKHGHGKQIAVKSDEILLELSLSGITTIGQTLRKIIGYIRQNDLMNPDFIISNVHTGYWLSNDPIELKGFIDQELNRMSHQYKNIQQLHQRIREGNKADLELSQMQLF